MLKNKVTKKSVYKAYSAYLNVLTLQASRSVWDFEKGEYDPPRQNRNAVRRQARQDIAERFSVSNDELKSIIAKYDMQKAVSCYKG
jgi:hypothetical protein